MQPLGCYRSESEHCAGHRESVAADPKRTTVELFRRRIGRKVEDIEHRPQQFGFRQDGLRLCNHVDGRILAALNVVSLLGGFAAKLIVVEDGATLL